MRRKDKLVTELKVIHEVINKAQVCRLGLVDDAQPYIVPLSFGFDGRDLYFHSALRGKKIEIMEKNDRVCVEFEDITGLVKADSPCDWGVNYFTVIGLGQARLIKDPVEKLYGLNQIVSHYQPTATPYSFTPGELAGVKVYKVTFDELVGKRS